MTPLRLLVNTIVGGFLLFAWSSFAPAFLGDAPAQEAYAFGRTLAAYLAHCFCALAAGWFLVLVAPRVRSLRWRVAFVASLGLFASLVGDFPRWNQGEFPGIWLLRQVTGNVLGFTLVGFFLAWRMKTNPFVPQKPASPR